MAQQTSATRVAGTADELLLLLAAPNVSTIMPGGKRLPAWVLVSAAHSCLQGAAFLRAPADQRSSLPAAHISLAGAGWAALRENSGVELPIMLQGRSLEVASADQGRAC